MARISRKAGVQTSSPSKKRYDVFSTALYVRLSVEDNGKEDADSLENQEFLLREYVANHPYLEIKEVYTDNGYTGTDYERPAFTKLIQDVRKGRIDCIVVKDFSRLGRNYVETGEYLERIFPFLGIRFISVNDGYDSQSANASEMLAASLKNLVNDMYAKDISKKICSTMKDKRIRGEYIGNYAPYGYLKDPSNRNRLIIDPEIAPIVVEIFELRAQGLGIAAMCKILNDKGYPSPGRLRFERGIITNNNKKGSALPWNRHVLTDLLLNVVYIGNLAQGRSAQCLYKGEKFHWTDSSEWDVVEDTHEPIIDSVLWDKVQKVNEMGSKAAKETHGKYSHLPKRPNPYGSVLRCADCGRVLKYVRNYSKPKKDGTVKDYYNYKCPVNIELGDSACPKKSIRADDLDNIVLDVLRKQMDLFLDTQQTLLALIALEKEKSKISAPLEQIKGLKEQLAKKKKLFSQVYTDFKDGILSQKEYLFARETYQEEISKLEASIREMESVKQRVRKTETGARKWNSLVNQYYKASALTSEMISAMVEEIRFHADGSLDVKFKYMLEFEEMFSECERIRKEVA